LIRICYTGSPGKKINYLSSEETNCPPVYYKIKFPIRKGVYQSGLHHVLQPSGIITQLVSPRCEGHIVCGMEIINNFALSPLILKLNKLEHLPSASTLSLVKLYSCPFLHIQFRQKKLADHVTNTLAYHFRLPVTKKTIL
jgi:hypothetical protein